MSGPGKANGSSISERPIAALPLALNNFSCPFRIPIMRVVPCLAIENSTAGSRCARPGSRRVACGASHARHCPPHPLMTGTAIPSTTTAHDMLALIHDIARPPRRTKAHQPKCARRARPAAAEARRFATCARDISALEVDRQQICCLARLHVEASGSPFEAAQSAMQVFRVMRHPRLTSR